MTKRIFAAAAVIFSIVAALACQPTAPDYRERLMSEIALRHGQHVTQSLMAMPFMQTREAGADLLLLHGVLRSGQIPMADINDQETWRAAAAHVMPRWKSVTDERLWKLEIHQLGQDGVSVGVLHQKTLPAQIPWHAIAAALDHSASLAGVPLPDHAGNSILIVYGAPVPGRSQATTYGSHIAIRNAYRNRPEAAAWILAHEVSHQWWYANAPYIDEGIAELTAYLANRGRRRPSLAATPCQKQTLQPKPDRAPVLCDYALGGDLFYDLMRQDPERFYRNLRNLHRLTPGAGLPELRRTFRGAAEHALLDGYFAAQQTTTSP